MLRGRPDPIPIAALIDHKTLQRTQYFADFLMAYKVYPGVNMYLEDTNGMMLDYRFGTSDPKKRFGSREISILNLLHARYYHGVVRLSRRDLEAFEPCVELREREAALSEQRG